MTTDNTQAELDEILGKAVAAGVDINFEWDGVNEFNRKFGDALKEAKQAITSLIKELVAEAKPARAVISDDEMGIDRARKSAANHAIDQFEQNLLKALEEV